MKRIIFLLSVFLALPLAARADVIVQVGPIGVYVPRPRPVVVAPVVPAVQPVQIPPGSIIVRPLLPWRPVVILPSAPEPKK